MNNKIVVRLILVLEILMIPAVSVWIIGQNLSMFDFSIFALYACIPILLAIMIYAIRIKSWLLITSTIVAGAIVCLADPITEDYVRTQGVQNHDHALLIISDLYAYHDKTGVWPDSLSQATNLNTEFTLGFRSEEFWYTKQDSTFSFGFPTENGGRRFWNLEYKGLAYDD